MYKFKKQSLTLLAFLLVGSGASIFSHTQTTTTTKKELLKSNPVSLVAPHYINDGIFDTSTDLTNDQMTCYLTSGSQTSNSITVNAEFSAANFVEWGDRNKAVYFVIDDEDWSGVPSDPSLSGKEMPTFAGYTSQLNFGSKSFIDDKTAKENFVIPSTMEYADGFYISNTRIQGGAVDFEGVDMTKFKVTNIVIPDTVLVVDAEAFKNVPASVTISCVVEEKPYDWDADWINEGANVVWGYKDETVVTDKTLNVKTGSNTISHITENSYLIGYINERDEEGNLAFPEFGEGYYPLTVQYEVVNADDTRVENTIELELLNVDPRNAPYDAVGTIGSASLSVPIDIYLDEGQTVDFTSFKFYNIYVAKRDDTTRKYGPDTATPYSIGSKKRFANLILLDDILTCKFDKVSTFADYTLVSMKVDKVVPYYYETIAESIVEENRALIDSGAYKIRYTLYNFNNADFRVTYKSGGVSKSVELDIASPLPIIEINKKKGNDISFILKNSDVGKDFSAEKMQCFEILNMSVNMHLWNTKNNSIVGRTSKVIKFGIVDVLPYKDNPVGPVNLNLAMILTYIIYTVVYVLISLGLFFFLKNKYKNDEFRRMKPKKYVKTATIGFFGFAVILLALIGIIYRTALFRNSLYAFNPSDVLVVLAGIVALVVIGYFIKFLVGMIKANKARKEILRLKLNEDVKNDGTN